MRLHTAMQPFYLVNTASHLLSVKTRRVCCRCGEAFTFNWVVMEVKKMFCISDCIDVRKIQRSLMAKIQTKSFCHNSTFQPKGAAIHCSIILIWSTYVQCCTVKNTINKWWHNAKWLCSDFIFIQSTPKGPLDKLLHWGGAGARQHITKIRTKYKTHFKQ